MKVLWLFMMVLLSHSTFANILQIKDEFVQPFEFEKTALEVVIQEVSNVLGINIVYTLDDTKKIRPVNLKIMNVISKNELKEYFFELLSREDLTFVEESFGGVVMNSRDSRDFHMGIFDSENIPNTNNYILVIYQMKWPLSSMMSRNFRSELSQYGRVIDFRGGRALLVYDKGLIAKYFVQRAKEFDTEDNSDKYLKKLQEDATAESKKTKEEKKIDELEDKIKDLGKKFYRVDNIPNKDHILRPGGIGLGLYVVFGLVKAFGSKLLIHSQAGKGSVFKFFLPVPFLVQLKCPVFLHALFERALKGKSSCSNKKVIYYKPNVLQSQTSL